MSDSQSGYIKVTREQLLADMQRVVAEAPPEVENPYRVSYYIEHMAYPKQKLYDHFPKKDGGWQAALSAAFPDRKPSSGRQPRMHHVEEKPRYLRKRRTCLAHNCGKPFLSDGPHIRICPRCKKLPSFQEGSQYETYSLSLP